MIQFYQLIRRLARDCKSEIAKEYTVQSRQITLWVPIIFACGIGGYFSLTFEPPLFLSIAMFLTFCSFLILIKEDQESITSPLKIILFISLIVIGGFTWTQIQTGLAKQPVIQKSLGPVYVSGTVYNIEYLPANNVRLMITDLEIERLNAEQIPDKIRLRYRGEIPARVGDNIAFLGQLHPPSAPVFPGGFDFQRYAFFRQIGAVGFIYGDLEILKPADTRFFQSVQKIREFIILQVDDMLQTRSGALISALMIGSRTAIEDGDVEAMRASGLAHILAISGLHLGLACGAVFFSVRLFFVLIPGLALRRPIKKYTAMIAILAGFFYMLMAGATVPTQRAFMMSALFFGAIIFDRSPFSLRFVALAALVILIMSPHILLSASFQMSFAAVTALIAFYERFSEQLSSLYRSAGVLKKIALYFLGLSMTTIIASTATAPFVLYHFQSWAVYGLIGNLTAIPILAFWIMPLIVISFCLMPFGLAKYTLYLAGQGAEIVLDIAHWISALPNSVLLSGYIPFFCLLGIVIAVLTIIFFRTKLVLFSFLFFGAAGFIFQAYQHPDLLLTSNLKLLGIYKEKYLYVSAKNQERFARKNWGSLLGLEEDSVQKWSALKDIECDDFGCRTILQDKKIAISYSLSTQEEDCNWADIVIAREALNKSCKALVKIDPIKAYNKGGGAVYLKGNQLNIKTVNQVRGQRPWTF